VENSHYTWSLVICTCQKLDTELLLDHEKIPNNVFIVCQENFENFYGPYSARSQFIHYKSFSLICSLQKLMSIIGIGDISAEEVFKMRPYYSIDDFSNRVNLLYNRKESILNENPIVEDYFTKYYKIKFRLISKIADGKCTKLLFNKEIKQSYHECNTCEEDICFNCYDCHEGHELSNPKCKIMKCGCSKTNELKSFGDEVCSLYYTGKNGVHQKSYYCYVCKYDVCEVCKSYCHQTHKTLIIMDNKERYCRCGINHECNFYENVGFRYEEIFQDQIDTVMEDN